MLGIIVPQSSINRLKASPAINGLAKKCYPHHSPRVFQPFLLPQPSRISIYCYSCGDKCNTLSVVAVPRFHLKGSLDFTIGEVTSTSSMTNITSLNPSDTGSPPSPTTWNF